MSVEERDRLAELRDAFERRMDNEVEGSMALLLQTFVESSYPTDAAAGRNALPAAGSQAGTGGPRV